MNTKKMPKKIQMSQQQQNAASGNLPRMMNIDEVAAFLRISRSGAYNHVNKQGFPKITIGKRVFVRQDSLMQWLQQNEKQNGWGA